MWAEWQPPLEDCKVMVWYSKHNDLYPLSDWIHPGAIPIGTGETDSPYYDLPNYEWMSRHLGWLGFRDILISSPILGKGIESILLKISKNQIHEFLFGYWYENLPKLVNEWKRDVMLVYGLNLTNSDLRHALLLHRQRRSKATLLSIRGLKFNVGLVKLNMDTKIIEAFQEKPVDRSQLLSSNILILDTSDQTVVEIIKECTASIPKKLKDEPSQILNKLLNQMIEKEILDTVELTGISDEPWFLDLARLENWIKLDVEEFINNFGHLIKKEE